MYFSQLCLVDRRPEISDGVRFQQQMEEVRLLDQQVYDRIPTTGRITGGPDDAIARVRWIRDSFGVTDIVNLTHFAGALDHDQVMGSLRLWAERVIPAFEPASRSAG